MTSKKEQYSPGERIVKAGDVSTAAYMIISGKVRVYLKNNDKVVDLAILEEGDIFGETAIFKDQGAEYGANVDALEETELLLITPDSLESMMEGCDPVLSALVTMLIKRLKETNQKLLQSETREHIDVAFI
ncbi:MAG: Crp/Fnr family transcriptional regulator [Alphaproteobacteria bacterium]